MISSSNLHENIAHLSQEQTVELMTRYYAGEKNAVLIDEFKIDVKVNQLHLTFPLLEHNESCPYCQVQMKVQPKSKSAYRKGMPFCEKCGHCIGSLACRCEGCQGIEHRKKRNRRLREIAVQERIQNTIRGLQYNKPLFEELTVRDKLYTAALLRACLSEDMRSIHPVCSTSVVLAPTPDYETKIILHLCNKRIIIPDVQATSSVMLNTNNTIQINARSTSFILNLANSHKTYLEIIESLLYPQPIEGNNTYAVFELWQEVAIHEGIEYLQARLQEYRLPIRVGEKTRLAMGKILEKYSVSQLFNFLWYSVKNAAAFRQKNGISLQHAANTVPGNIIKRYEYANAENWSIKGFDRDSKHPESAISAQLNNYHLGTGIEGFGQPIRLETLCANFSEHSVEIIYETFK